MTEQTVGLSAGKTAVKFEDRKDQLLAKLALKHKCVSVEQVHEALAFQREQKQRGTPVTLQEFFVARGMISQKQLATLSLARTFLLRRDSEQALSEAAISSGLVSREQVDEAMARQVELFKLTKSFKPLTDIWVETGLLSPDQRTALLAAVPQPDLNKGPARLPPASAGRQTGGGESNLAVTVSDDRLEAYLVADNGCSGEISVQDVKDLLGCHGITYGVVADASIETWLRQLSGPAKPFTIARGQPPKPGKNAELKYLFEDHWLCAGTLDEKGRIDFKEKGRAPCVAQGDVIAEKIPCAEGVPGVDVFGCTLPVEKPRDRHFLCGPGVEVAKDNLKVIAKVNGRPQLSPVGRLSVWPEMHIAGDVDMETGNIHFSGLIHVQGVVQDGFQVTGGSLVAAEISRASIRVAGDVHVHGGIVGAKISAEGSVTASHIHWAEVEALGDVRVTNGVVDSKIAAGGKCQVEGGAVLSSQIAAGQGIDATQIGSESSIPCTLKVGQGALAGQKEIERVEALLEVANADKSSHLSAIAEFQEQLPRLELKIGELVQIQDRGSLERKDLEQQLKTAGKLDQQTRAEHLESAIAQVDATIRTAEKDLEEHFERQDALKQKLGEHRNLLAEVEQRTEALTGELDAIHEWLRQPREDAGVRVQNVIYGGTFIQGDFASVTLKSDLQEVRVREVKCFESGQDPGSSVNYRIEFSALV